MKPEYAEIKTHTAVVTQSSTVKKEVEVTHFTVGDEWFKTEREAQRYIRKRARSRRDVRLDIPHRLWHWVLLATAQDVLDESLKDTPPGTWICKYTELDRFDHEVKFHATLTEVFNDFRDDFIEGFKDTKEYQEFKRSLP